MRRLTAAAWVWAALAGSALADEIVFATDADNPPYSFLDEANDLRGFEWEFGEALCQHLELTCTWVAMPRESLIPGLMAGEADAVIAAMPAHAEYDAAVTFTQPYIFPDIYSYIGLSGSELPFGAGTVGVLPGRDLTAFSRETGRHFEEFQSLDEALIAVRDGSVNAILAERRVLYRGRW